MGCLNHKLIRAIEFPDTFALRMTRGCRRKGDLEQSADLGPLGGAEVLASASLLGDRRKVNTSVLIVGIELGELLMRGWTGAEAGTEQ